MKDSTAEDSIATQEIGVRKAQVQGEVKKEEYEPDVKLIALVNRDRSRKELYSVSMFDVIVLLCFRIRVPPMFNVYICVNILCPTLSMIAECGSH